MAEKDQAPELEPDLPSSVKDLAEEEDEEEAVEQMEVVSGSEFPNIDLADWVAGYRTLGFQGTHLFRAVEEIKRMEHNGSKIFLGYTSNLVSSGLRDVLRKILQHKKAHVVVSTAGGIEEDIIKVLRPSRLGDYSMDGAELRSKGLNRVGNVLIPNRNYVAFEKWITELFDDIVDGKIPRPDTGPEGRPVEGYRMLGNTAVITPSRLVYEMGRKIQSEESIYYWAYAHGVPVYCPAITDGSIGDMITFYKRKSRLVVDIAEDIARINREGIFARSTGAIILGAGIVKHHILNANLFRNGLDHCVLINTAQEYDGSDAGARIDEAVSWGKIVKNSTSVKVHADATLVLPILVHALWGRTWN